MFCALYFSDCKDEKKLMSWLFNVVVEISKQKFENLTFSCGHLCPHARCLERHIVTEVEDHDMRVFHYDDFNQLRRQGLAAAKCLYQVRLSAAERNRDDCMNPRITSINSVLSAAQTEAHVEEMFKYTNGRVCRYVDDVVLCDFADPGVSASQHLGQEPEAGSLKPIRLSLEGNSAFVLPMSMIVSHISCWPCMS